jgi:colicin import membrane protein
MGHAESPSLISLGLATDVSQEDSSFRWGLVTSGFLHVLVVVLAMFVRFQSTTEEPFRAIDVALISLPETKTSAPSKANAAPSVPSPPKAPPKDPPKSPPMENAFPPLPTQTASERLSEFLRGAVGSIVVPNTPEIDLPATPPQITDHYPSKDQSPLIENLRLPPTAPQLSRPERLRATEPIIIPKTDVTPPRQKTTQSTMVPPEPKEPASPPQPAKMESTVKPAPAPPELSPVAPFKKTKQEVRSTDFSASKNLEESLKRTIPTIPTPSPTRKIQKKPNPVPRQQEKSYVPEISAPQLAQAHPSQPPEKPSQRGKMSEMMKQLLGEVKVPTLKAPPPTPRSQESGSSSSPSTKPVQSEIDQRIAKLSIPTITPVESIKNRLQLLEVQSTSNSRNASSQSSAGTNHYYGMIQDLIQDQWRNTPLVADAPVVVLKFRIARSGEISQIRIDKSSGNGYYDSAARRAVHAVNPLPPFPPDISDSFLDVRFQFIKTDQKD